MLKPRLFTTGCFQAYQMEAHIQPSGGGTTMTEKSRYLNYTIDFTVRPEREFLYAIYKYKKLYRDSALSLIDKLFSFLSKRLSRVLLKHMTICSEIFFIVITAVFVYLGKSIIFDKDTVYISIFMLLQCRHVLYIIFSCGIRTTASLNSMERSGPVRPGIKTTHPERDENIAKLKEAAHYSGQGLAEAYDAMVSDVITRFENYVLPGKVAFSLYFLCDQSYDYYSGKHFGSSDVYLQIYISGDTMTVKRYNRTTMTHTLAIKNGHYNGIKVLTGSTEGMPLSLFIKETLGVKLGLNVEEILAMAEIGGTGIFMPEKGTAHIYHTMTDSSCFISDKGEALLFGLRGAGEHIITRYAQSHKEIFGYHTHPVYKSLSRDRTLKSDSMMSESDRTYVNLRCYRNERPVPEIIWIKEKKNMICGHVHIPVMNHNSCERKPYLVDFLNTFGIHLMLLIFGFSALALSAVTLVLSARYLYLCSESILNLSCLIGLMVFPLVISTVFFQSKKYLSQDIKEYKEVLLPVTIPAKAAGNYNERVLQSALEVIRNLEQYAARNGKSECTPD
ncbi:MAG: hypothetical protein AB2L14_00635 [Candidatus Xenobiia bacterium LiM19]